MAPGKEVPVRFLIRIAQQTRNDDEFLANVRSIATNLGVQARNPKWTTLGALEIDLFAPTREDIHLCLAALEPLGRTEFVHDLMQAPEHKSKSASIQEARDLFNHERYWEGHEVLEGVWRTLSGEEKFYVQGLILVCAAFVHHQKREDSVGQSVLRRALKQLDYPEVAYNGIEVGRLKKEVEEMIESGAFRPYKI